MKFEHTDIEGLTVIQAEPFEDSRGVFRRHYCAEEYSTGELNPIVSQINISENYNELTLRGFHYQESPFEEDKTLAVLSGRLFNVVIDLRSGSNTFLQYLCFELNAAQRKSLFVPKGCANAFLTLEKNTTVLYCMSEKYHPGKGNGIRYNDPYFNVPWPKQPSCISEKDLSFPDFDPGAM